MSESKRRCTRCTRNLPVDQFRRRYAGGPYRGACSSCLNEVERQRVARVKERAHSDYEALTTDDFAVGVGNVPETPTQAASRSKASEEKRQEYNRMMGETLSAVRDVAAGEEGELPDKVFEYLSFLSEQERRFGNRRLARSTAISLAHDVLGTRYFMRAAEKYFSDRVAPAGYSARPKPPPSPGALDRVVNILLSDLHLGADLSGVDNPMPFRRLEESRRLAHVFREVLDYKSRYRDRSLCRVWLNGDLIQGMLLHDLRDGAPLTEQMLIFWHLFRQGLALLAAHFPRVEVECQGGNHGRDKIRHPGRATSSKWDGHEWRMMYALSKMFSDVPNIRFNLPRQAVSVVNCFGSMVAATHGDTEVPLSNPTTRHDDNVAELQKINATRELGCEVDVWLLGHFHSAFLAPGKPTVLYNGMLVPPDGYARSKGHRGKPCGQWVWESVEGFPLGDARFVHVGPAQDSDASLDSVLAPLTLT